MPTFPEANLSILVIDDDEIMRELLAALLAAEGYVVDTAESGEAALAQLEGGCAADVLLCDMQLPGLRGAALSRELREAAPQACLLGMSGGEPAPEDLASVHAFLLKPFSMDDFAQAISVAISAEGAVRARVPKMAAAAAVLDEDTYARLARSIPPAQMAELYQLTLSDIANKLESMREALARCDEGTFRSEAHALKGGCSMVGAAEIAALAARAETGSFGDTPALAEFTAAAERLRSIMAARSTVHP